MSTDTVHPKWWLVLGAVLGILSQMRWGIGMLAWFAPVPFLYYLSRETGWRARLWLLLALLITVHLAVAKIVTPPLTFLMVPMFALPGALSLWLIYVLWDEVRRRAGVAWAVYALPALTVASEWVQYAFTPFGVWGAVANTQLDNLPLLQLASLTGAGGVSFLVAWGGALLAAVLIDQNWRRWRGHAAALALAVTLASGWGTWRLTTDLPGPQVRAAAVASTLLLSGTDDIPPEAELARHDDTLFGRTAEAARRGARLIVWNEAAAVLTKEREPAFLARGAALARQYGVQLVMAYAVALPGEPFRFENKYQWLQPDGTIAEEYLKHHPVPGEPAVPGTTPLRAIDTGLGRFAGAICYDYDFPRMAVEQARLGVGLVALPSSDWKGIDPSHTRMAGLRAIEGGFSLLRSVRAATSMGIDAHGRVRASMSWFEDHDGIMLVSLPSRGVPTLYSRTGDLLPWACLFLLGVMVVAGWRKKR